VLSTTAPQPLRIYDELWFLSSDGVWVRSAEVVTDGLVATVGGSACPSRGVSSRSGSTTATLFG